MEPRQGGPISYAARHAAKNVFNPFFVVDSLIAGTLFCTPEGIVGHLERLWPGKRGRASLGRAGDCFESCQLAKSFAGAVVATTAFSGAQVKEARRAGV